MAYSAEKEGMYKPVTFYIDQRITCNEESATIRYMGPISLAFAKPNVVYLGIEYDDPKFGMLMMQS